MKRTLSAFLAVLLCLTLFLPAAAAPSPLDGVAVFSPSSGRYESASVLPVGLTLDGSPLATDVPALLYQERTMVPVRPIAEALGAEVGWHQGNRQVTLTTGEHVIVLTIGSSTAQVDGAPAALPDGVSAQLVQYQGSNSTMVPLRFVSEQLGCTVDWDPVSYTAILLRPGTVPEHPLPSISLPEETIPPPPPTEEPVLPTPPSEPEENVPGEPQREAQFTVRRIVADDNAQTVFLSLRGEGDVTYIVQEMDQRAVVDVLNAQLRDGIPSTIYMENEIFSSVRYAEHTNLYDVPSVRVVLDLRSGFSCSENVEVKEENGGILIRSFRESSSTGTFIPSVPITPGTSIVVLDAGHGGALTGAMYEGIKEKDLNLAVTKKVAAILIRHGYNVIMTRSDDTDIGLVERANIANAINADIFVSIHSNANEDPSIFGVSTYHFPQSRRGSLLAQSIQTAAASATGAKNRGILSANFAVLRETDMAAALVEMGFMTNHSELMQLADEAYQAKMAQGIADGIVRYLNSQKL